MYLLSQMRNTLQETAYNLPYVGRKNRHLFNYFLYLWNTFYTFSLLLSLIMFLVTIPTFPTLGLNHKGINLRWCKKPVPACLYPFQQGRVSAHSFLPGFLLHLTKRDGVMPDFSYDKGDDGIMDNKAGWLKQFSSPSPPLTEQCNSNQRDFQEFLGQIIGKLLGLYCGFFFCKIYCTSPQSNMQFWWQYATREYHTANGEKPVWCQQKYIVQTNGWDSALLNATAVIWLFLSPHSWFK